MLNPRLKAMAPMCRTGFATNGRKSISRIDLNAKEDRGQEEKFVPRPYYGGRSSTTKKAEKKKAEKPAAKKEKAANTAKENEPLDDQLSFDSLGVSA